MTHVTLKRERAFTKFELKNLPISPKQKTKKYKKQGNLSNWQYLLEYCILLYCKCSMGCPGPAGSSGDFSLGTPVFRPPLTNSRLEISEIFLKGP